MDEFDELAECRAEGQRRRELRAAAKKRKKPSNSPTTRRTTRSMSRKPTKRIRSKVTTKKKITKKEEPEPEPQDPEDDDLPPEMQSKKEAETDTEGPETEPEPEPTEQEPGAVPEPVPDIRILYCKQSRSFRYKANRLAEEVRKRRPSTIISLNPDTETKGRFEVYASDGRVFVATKDKQKPFKNLTAINVADTVERIAAYLEF